MKKILLLWMGALVLTMVGFSSCSSDEEQEFKDGNLYYTFNDGTLNGTWHMVSADYGFGGTETYQAGEITVIFNEAEKKIEVKNKKNIHFLKSGIYPYEITTEKSRIYTHQWVDVISQVIVIQYTDEAYGNREVKYICGFHDGMLVLDGGMASDGPGYYFKKPMQN